MKKSITYGMYDFSNSGYVLIFQSFLFPIFLASALEGGTYSSGLWGTAVSISVFTAIILSPIIGSIGDRTNKLKVFATFVVFCGIGATLSPWLFSDNGLALVIAFIFFNCLFQVTLSLYDSFLKDFSKNKSEELSISTFAWGFGYLGGITFLIFVLGLQKIGVSNSIILSLSGCLYLLLSLFALWQFMKHLPNRTKKKIDNKVIIEGKGKFLNFKKEMVLPLITYWLIADCVAAIVYFSGLYAKTELGISITTIGVLMLGVQLIGFFTTWYSGILSKKIGLHKSIFACLAIWLLVLFGLFLSKNVYHLSFVMLLTALVIGSTQALMRAHFADKVQHKVSGENFGYYSVATKSAAVIAPASIGWFSEYFGGMRFAFLAMIIPVLLAMILWSRTGKK